MTCLDCWEDISCGICVDNENQTYEFGSLGPLEVRAPPRDSMYSRVSSIFETKNLLSSGMSYFLFTLRTPQSVK